MTERDLLSTEQTLAATTKVIGILPKIAGVVAGISALGLFAGWRELSAYYSTLGAPWISGLLSTSQIFERSAVLMSTIGAFTLISIMGLAAGESTEKGLRTASIATLGLSTLFFLCSLSPIGWFEKSTIYHFAQIASLLIAVSSGLLVGELIAGLAKRKLMWSGYHIWLLYFFFLVALRQTPDQLGRAKAQFDSSPTSNSMPIVSINVAVPGRTWRLVTTAGTSFIVVALGDTPEKNTFRVVAASEIIEITSSHLK